LASLLAATVPQAALAHPNAHGVHRSVASAKLIEKGRIYLYFNALHSITVAGGGFRVQLPNRFFRQK
jgi:hypothetical protein